MRSSTILEQLITALPEVSCLHAPSTNLHCLLKTVARSEALALFSEAESEAVDLSPLGQVVFPFHQMGAVDTVNLFDLDELILFSFYWVNRGMYNRVLDIGANLGLHSIVLQLCGYEVRSFEPDPVHFDLLMRNLKLNRADTMRARNAAVSSESGTTEFIRLLGNTTGSHIEGARVKAYGPTERLEVELVAFGPELEWADLVKMDVEGHEAEILLSTTSDDWRSTDCVVEIQNDQNAKSVYEHFKEQGVGLYAQKENWGAVQTLSDMPKSYRDGSLFISTKGAVPWGTRSTGE